jgi:hypothetical protein
MADNKKSREDYNLPLNKQRKVIRRSLFGIRDAVMKGKLIPEKQMDLKEYIESQFEFGMNWSNFTFIWDVSARDFLKVIKEDQWEEEGGRYDGITGMNYPSSFTHQR